MYREISIRIGVNFFIHKTLEKIKLFFQSIKFIFITRKNWIELAFDNEEDDSVEDDATLEFDVDFNPSTTVLFSSDYRKQWPKLDKHSLIIFRFKVQQECIWLTDKGYTDFFVNYGCNYGIVALSELLYMKNKLNLDINLCYGKVMHEHASCVTKLDSIAIIQICHDHGVKYMEVFSPSDFIEKVICKVSRISSELGIMKTDQKIPESMHEHYKKLEQKLHYSGV